MSSREPDVNSSQGKPSLTDSHMLGYNKRHLKTLLLRSNSHLRDFLISYPAQALRPGEEMQAHASVSQGRSQP